MAQFSHPELGGTGQWMPTMIMIGDMFNNTLAGRVASLFADLAKQPTDLPSAPSAAQPQVSMRYGDAGHDGTWYPPELGHPSTSGSQNNVRYAYFSSARRLAIELHGRVTIYDTGDHWIGGVAQDQSGAGGSLTFTSQHGVVPLSALPVVST